MWYISQKTTWSNTKKGLAIIGVIILAVLIYGGDKSSNKPKQNEVAVSENKQPQQEEPKATTQEVKTEPAENTKPAETEKQSEVKLPKYEIVYEIKNKRYDGGINYYVLVDPINLANDDFKNDIKAIIRQIVKDKGSKISIDFVDNKSVLDLEYKSHYGSNTLGRILTKTEMDQQGLHLIAIFSGELKTDIYPNSLSFFPSTFTDNPKVGKYVENIEFNPSQY